MFTSDDSVRPHDGEEAPRERRQHHSRREQKSGTEGGDAAPVDLLQHSGDGAREHAEGAVEVDDECAFHGGQVELREGVFEDEPETLDEGESDELKWVGE